MKTCLFFLLCACLVTGCAGGHCYVTARSVPQPVSCTPCVFDASGNICSARPSEVVRHVVLSKCNWSLLWKAVPLNDKKWDISDELNADLKQTPGNAVVNVTVKAEGCNFLQWYLAAIIPIIPSYEDVTVEGDIVQMPN
jgi:hypothetical protein